MKSVYLACLTILIAVCPSAVSQTPPPRLVISSVNHAQRIARLRKLFLDLGLELPTCSATSSIENAGSCDLSFDELQSFSDRVHQWAMSAPTNLAADEVWQKLAEKSYPSLAERTLRATQAKIEIIEQPKTITITDPTTGVGTPSPNPDRQLLRVSSVTNYSELVPSPSDILQQATVLRSAGSSAATAAWRTDSDGESLRNCLLRTGFVNMFLRDLSGIKGTFNWSQNPQVQQNVLVPSAISNQNRIFSGEIDFDPSKLFLTGSDWLAAYQAAQLYGRDAEKRFARQLGKECAHSNPKATVQVPEPGNIGSTSAKRSGLISPECAMRLARPHGGYAIAAALVPTVTYTVKSQFDFIANSGFLTAAPYRTNNLGDLTLSVDLTRLIPTAKSRSDALATLVAAQANKPAPPADPTRADIDQQVRNWASEPEQIDDDDIYKKLRIALLAARQP